MNLGAYLRELREKRGFTLRDVERLAKEKKTGTELSSGYLSMLERGDVKQPSPRILFVLANIYGEEYMNLMKKAGYIHENVDVGTGSAKVAFRGADHLTDEQKERVQHFIDLELRDAIRSKRRRKE